MAPKFSQFDDIKYNLGVDFFVSKRLSATAEKGNGLEINVGGVSVSDVNPRP